MPVPPVVRIGLPAPGCRGGREGCRTAAIFLPNARGPSRAVSTRAA